MSNTKSIPSTTYDKRLKRFVVTTETPICKKCAGDLNSSNLVTSVSVDGGDIGEGFNLYAKTKTITLFSCKNPECQWYGLLTQLIDSKKETTTHMRTYKV